MSSMEKIQKTSKKTVKKSPVIVEDESDDECVMKPVRSSSKTKPKSLERAKNPFIDYESLEDSLEEREELESGGEQEKDSVSSDVEEPKESGDKAKENEIHLLVEQREEEGREEQEDQEEQEETSGGEEDVEGEEAEVEEILPCFLCKSDMKIVTKDGQQMLFCSAGAAVCTPPFTTPATYLALREMSKAIHPKYVHIKKGTPPRCDKHNIPMALSFCKSSSEKFVCRPVFKCAVRAGKNPLTNKEDVSFSKCADGLFEDLANMAKARNEYKVYQAQVLADKARAIRSKNLVVKSLKIQEAQDRLSRKKRKSSSEGNSASNSKVRCKTPVLKK